MNDSELTKLIVEEVFRLLKGVERDYHNSKQVPSTGTILHLEEE